MQKGKRLNSVLLAVVLATTMLSACGGSKNTETTQASAKLPVSSTTVPVVTTTAPATSATTKSGNSSGTAKYKMTIALHTNDGTIECQAINRFKQEIEEKTKGDIEVDVFPGATIGTEEENLEQIKTNEIQGSIFGDVMTSQLAADLDPTVTPFIFTNVDDVLEVWSGDLGKKINEACIKNGNLTVLGVGRRGARYLIANKEIKDPSGLKGLKLRLPSITNWVTIWESMGALATPIAFSEVYTSLQTGVVDAFESTLELTNTGKYYEVTKYAMKTEHLYGLFHFAVCNSWLKTLPEDYQKMIREAGAECCKWGDEKAAANEAEMAKQLQEHGMTIVDVDKQVFVNAAMPAIKKVAEKWQPGVWDSISKYIKQ